MQEKLSSTGVSPLRPPVTNCCLCAWPYILTSRMKSMAAAWTRWNLEWLAKSERVHKQMHNSCMLPVGQAENGVPKKDLVVQLHTWKYRNGQNFPTFIFLSLKGLHCRMHAKVHMILLFTLLLYDWCLSCTTSLFACLSFLVARTRSCQKWW